MKNLKVLSIALLVALCLTSTKVWAQDEPKQDASFQDETAAISVSDLEALNNRLNALEKAKASSLTVDGLFQFWYSHNSFGTNVAGSSNDYNTAKNQWDAFSVKRAEIALTGALGSDPKVSFKLSLDPSLASFSGIGTTANTGLTYAGQNGPGASAGNINPFTLVKDLYGQVAYSPYATVIFGQNKLWNELEGRTSTRDLDFNNYSSVGGNGFGNKRDPGVQVSGSGIVLGPLQAEYAVGLVQGSGQSTADNNVDKDVVARIGVTYDKNLFLGSSVYDGWEVNGVRQDIGFEGRWVSGGLKIQGEFITGSVNTLDNSSANDSAWVPSISLSPKGYAAPTGQLSPTGYYLFANYRLDDWRLGARWDGYNFDQGGPGTSDQEWDTYTVGLDWYQAKDSLKLSINWEDHLLSGADVYNIWTVQSQIYI